MKLLTHFQTHWGRGTHIIVGEHANIDSANGLAPNPRKTIIWTNAWILLTEPLATNFNETIIEIHTFSFKKMHLKLSSGKCRPSCLGLIVLKHVSERGTRCILQIMLKLRGSLLRMLMHAGESMCYILAETNIAWSGPYLMELVNVCPFSPNEFSSRSNVIFTEMLWGFHGKAAIKWYLNKIHINR